MILNPISAQYHVMTPKIKMNENLSLKTNKYVCRKIRP